MTMDHQSPVIGENGTLQGCWDRSFERSVLDQGVPYPADMSALPTSTPNPEKLRRRSRRTWFDTTPADGKLEIAVEQPEIQIPKKKLQCHSTEVLTLTHFSAAPRLDYGTVKMNQKRMCILLIRNPHDYEQTVRIEKVPEKKHFSVPVKDFVVGGGESFPLEITWAPVESGNFREMIRLHVDASYRLQAYVYGKVQSPQKKRRVRKTGLMASKVSAPFSVIHTNSLSNINQQYSPEKRQGNKVKRNGTQFLAKGNGAQVLTKQKPADKPIPRKSPRLSGRMQEKGIQPDHFNVENIEPEAAVICESSAVVQNCQPQAVMSSLPKPMIEEKIPKKKMRRSNTYSNVSGTGLLIPIIKGENVQGHKDTSELNIDSCNISGISPLQDSLAKDEQIEAENKVDSICSLSSSICMQANIGVNLAAEPSFIVTDEKVVSEKNQPYEMNPRLEEPSFLLEVADRSKLVSAEPSFLSEVPNKTRLADAEPSFFNSPFDNAQNQDRRNPLFDGVKTNQSFQDSLECTQNLKNSHLMEPSFLAQSETKENVKPKKLRRSSRGKGGKLEKEDIPTERKLMRSLKRRSSKHIVSPDSFLKVTRSSVKQDKASVDNTHRPLNDSVGQSSILEQVRNLRAYVHEKSVELSGNESFLSDTSVAKSECKKRSSSKVTVQGTDIDIRRETFVTKAKNIKMLEKQEPSEASPRRTTFTIVKKAEKMKLPKRSRSEGSPCTTKPGTETNIFKIPSGQQILQLDTVAEGNSLEVFDTKDEQQFGVSLDSAPRGDNTAAKREQRFSADSLENESQEEKFGSPSNIIQHPSENIGRRATLTVTKSRPSDALLGYAKRSEACGLFSIPQSYANYGDTKHIPPLKGDISYENCEVSSKSAQNSTFEVSVNHVHQSTNESSFPTTPNQLPSSPNPDLSRRSTHTVDKPRVLDLSRADRKQLFMPEKTNHSDAEIIVDEMIANKDDEIKNETEMIIESKNKDVLRETNDMMVKEIPIEIKIVEKKILQLDCQNACPENILNSNDSMKQDSPSMNTRRRLSGKRSLIDTDKDKQREQSETQEKGQLFFVALDDSLEKDAPVKKNTVRKDPSQFLRKRSNPVTQAEDARVKRPKSNLPTVRTTEPSRAWLRPGLSARQTVTQKPVQPKPTRTLRNNTKDTGAGKEVRHVMKPKANLMKGVGQSKLILVKKSKAALAKHPLPFAAKNMYYDERWMEKQERGFVNWLNFILTPAEEYQGNSVKVKVDAGKLVVDEGKKMVKLAPTNEVLSFRAYSAHKRLNRLRKCSCRLFQSDQVIKVIQKLEAEVESGRLLVRKDKMLHADLGAKQKILDMLISYNPLWLRIGLETIYGEVVPLQSNTDVYGLSRFILTRMLYSPDIAAQYAHPTVPNLYRDGYAEATAQHTLKKFLMLVFFLEKAKLARLLDHNPCLFCKDSDVKTSKDLLLHFSRDFLSGEGDITRHLGYLGYKVCYSQTALDEFDFAVSNLSTDLRDGLRLSRVLELLCNKPELSKSLRAPAISRLQKIHNVESAFKLLASQGLDTGGVTARDIVDGHREKTLKLLWTIILQYQVQVLLDEAQLRDEVELLQKSLRLHNQLHCLLNYKQDMNLRRESKEPELHTQNEKLDLLMKWCRCVCAFHNIKIENFTVSFSDGRALCHILHYYHPGLLPLDKIHADTVMTHMESLERNNRQSLSTSINDSINSSAVFGDLEDPELLERLQNNEKENFKVLFEKVKELGGVPLMLKWSDMSGTIPDEKVVVTYLLYLCARLLDIRLESRAARVIQIAWRKHRLRKLKEEYKMKHQAATVIQQAVRKFLQCHKQKREQGAALCIQKVWRGHCGRREAKQRRQQLVLQKQEEVIKVIQAHIKGHLQRKKFLQVQAAIVKIQSKVRAWLVGREQRQAFLTKRQAACVIQSTWKMYLQKQAYKKSKRSVVMVQAAVRKCLAMKRYKCIWQAVVTLQRHYRMKCKTDQTRERFLHTRTAVICLQAATRGYLTRKGLKQHAAAATVLQSVIRCYLERKRFLQLKQATSILQRIYRAKTEMNRCRQQFLIAKRAAITIQSSYRTYQVQKAMHNQQHAATKIQAFVRGCMQRGKYHMLKSRVIMCQRFYRNWQLGQQVRHQFLIMKGAAITIQATVRMFLQQRRYQQMRAAVVKVQSCTRTFQQRSKYLKLKHSVVVCQRLYRQKTETARCREQYLRTKRSTVVLQSAVRGHLVRKALKHRHNAATVIQAAVRCYQARAKFLQIKQAAILVQRSYRLKCQGSLVRKEFLVKKLSAITIQSALRGYLVRKSMTEKHRAATAIHAWFKGSRQRKLYLKLKSVTVLCQRQFRNKMVATECRKQYLISRGAAITIQAAVRGYLRRKEMTCTAKAAILIQTHVRGYLQRHKFQQKKGAALTLQKYYRAKQAGTKCRQHFKVIKNATVMLQSVVRGYLTRKELKYTAKAATLIQAGVRGYLERKKYLQKRNATITLQKFFRARREGVNCRRHYLVIRSAIITLQASVRGYLTRKDLMHTAKAALLIQAHLRGYLVRKKYLQKLRAAIILQKYFRARQEGAKCRQQFLSVRNATITLQAAIRGYKVRQVLHSQHRSAKVIQSHVKGFLARARYLQLRRAVVTCQRLVRCRWQAQECRQAYHITRQAVVTIQSSVRRFLVRRSLQHKIQATTVIQSHIKSYLARKCYRKLRDNVIMCQKVFRSNQASKKTRQEFLIAKGAAITIQAVYRGYLARREIKHQHQAATAIQSGFRVYLASKRYQILRQNVIICQRQYRAGVESKLCRQRYLTMKAAVVTLQSAFRGWVVRKEQCYQHKAAMKVQSCIRGFLARRSYCRLKKAVTMCQRQYRANKACQKCRLEYLITKGAIITVQAVVRGHLARKDWKLNHKAATKIQTALRGHLERKKYLRLRQATLQCQTLYRSNLLAKECRQKFLITKKAAVTLQAAFRGHRVRCEQKKRHHAAVIIQAHIRSFQARQHYHKLKHCVVVCQRLLRKKLEAERCRRQFLVSRGAAITLQANIRGFLMRKFMKRMIAAAIRIQAVVRGCLARRRFLQMLHAVIVCQRRYRATLEQRRCQHQYRVIRQATITLQSVIRGYLIRRELQYRHLAATSIQACVRGYLQKQSYCRLRGAAICLQRHYRAKQTGEKCRAELRTVQKSAAVLQAAWRGIIVRREMRLRYASATVIQSVIRQHQSRQRFLSLRQAAIVCQRRFRQKQRELYLHQFARSALQSLSAVVIQRYYKKYRVTQLGKAKLHSVTVIQRWIRSKLRRLKFLRDRQRVICLQRRIRHWLCRRHQAAIVIQLAVRKWMGGLEERKTVRAATKIQAYWRGHCTRKNSKSKKLTAARHRIQKATASATDDKKLGNRTTSALDFLLRYKQLSHVLDALVNLEVATRLSWVCCERLVAADAVTVLYRLIRGCNRSLPHMEVIKYTVCVMLNVAKYEQTRPYLYAEEEGVATLLELLSIYREKKGPIFTKTCNLLGIMALEDTCKLKILQDSRLREKLLSIHNLTARKHKMEENQRVTRAKMNATINSTFNSTFVVRSPVKRHSIKPDWSLQKDRMNEIENPLKAINFVLVVVGLQSKSGRPVH